MVNNGSSILWILALLCLLVAPGLLGGESAIFSAFVLIATFAVMAYGLDVIVSDLGEVSLTHPVFFAAGAYATAIASSRYNFDPASTLVLTIVVSLAIAALISLVTLNLREFVFSLVTYAVTVVSMTIAANWAFLGGSDGVTGIPVFRLFGYTAGTDKTLWPIAWGLLALTIYVIGAFRRSALGQAAMTVHLNPRLATMSGIDPRLVRIKVFMVSAPITATAGWLYAYQRAYVSADVLDMYFLILSLTAVVLVGRRMLAAPLLGVALILLQEKFLSFGAYYDRIILGGVLIVVLSFLPRGLAGLFGDAGRLILRRKKALAYIPQDLET
ncbi:branched-chain amino acid ABC transporter permease [Rhizobium sp. SSA_523]|uniref:branched-chain amino acid ABC transporter permease n=1 Tax=Rhizobium sp. SSA_523 TaxID=2952477 RepID=UPI002090EC6B|nr:branched-chain amino acid ABC transporter permease [Rhizobium sp. SSA_523]MCO5731655.1 branched-chain amino acid ABC transporter permease [Rhizobium sp. SSA_523]WKC21840.1 branched-chain amino acid ABC transporter permease [Rhizobium sp. SSA_523]